MTGLLARAGGPGAGLNVHANVATEAFLYADEMLKQSKTLLDPIEFDPEAMGKEEAKKKEETEPK